MPVNGEPLDTIAISDRGLAYGDGLFETILIHDTRLVLLEAHLDRLCEGAHRLHITLERQQLEADIARLAAQFPEQGILKIIITRGSGGRGYAPAESADPSRILTLHEMPDYSDRQPEAGIDVFVCQQRLAQQPALAGLKHLNRLEQVLASLEWPAPDFMEGLMLDTAGHVIEGTRSNLFWAEKGQLMTPSISQCGVAGIMRQYLLQVFGDAAGVEDCSLARLSEADEVFFCNSVFGIWPVRKIRNGDTWIEFSADRRQFSQSGNQAIATLLAPVSS